VLVAHNSGRARIQVRLKIKKDLTKYPY